MSIASKFRRLSVIRGAKRVFRAPWTVRAVWRDRLFRGRTPHTLAVCAIFRDEAKFLDEWVRFHAGIGVSQFFLYDNGSRDHFRDVLRPFVEDGLVTLEHWPRRPGQRSAYLDYFRRRWRTARWTAFIDIDEFIFSPRQLDIRPILESYADVPSLFVHSLNFGSSGHQVPPPGSLIEAYTRCEFPARSVSGKSIVNPRLARNVSQSHVFPLWRGQTQNTRRVAIPMVPIPPDTVPAFETLQINHYWSRSIQDLADKVARGDAFYGVERDLDQHLRFERGMNETTDTSIIPIWRSIAGTHT
jgi:hypothetical protein